MSKKKKKKKNKNKGISTIKLKEVDKNLMEGYEAVTKEIEDYRIKLYLADQEARKKAKKKIKKDPKYFETSHERIEARRKVINEMEGNSFFERMEKILNDIAPVIVIISRLVAALILTILCIDPVRIGIKKETYDKMQVIFNSAMAIGR